jgi:hypothetical protein
MAMAKKDFAQYGAGGKPPCMKHETHATCKLGDAECSSHHWKHQLTDAGIGKLLPQTRAWAVADGGFLSQKEVSRGERSGVIRRMIAEIDKSAGRSTSGKGTEVPKRASSLYAGIVLSLRPLEHELANVLRGGGGLVFGERPDEPRWRSEVASGDMADTFSQVPGLCAKQERIFGAILPLVSPPLESRSATTECSWPGWSSFCLGNQRRRSSGRGRYVSTRHWLQTT